MSDDCLGHQKFLVFFSEGESASFTLPFTRTKSFSDEENLTDEIHRRNFVSCSLRKHKSRLGHLLENSVAVSTGNLRCVSLCRCLSYKPSPYTPNLSSLLRSQSTSDIRSLDQRGVCCRRKWSQPRCADESVGRQRGCSLMMTYSRDKNSSQWDARGGLAVSCMRLARIRTSCHQEERTHQPCLQDYLVTGWLTCFKNLLWGSSYYPN